MTTPVSTDFECALKLASSAAPLHGDAVVEHQVGPQRDGPGGVVRVGDDRLGQVGGPVAVGSDDGEGVEDGAGVHDAHLVEAGLGGVEALLLGIDPEDQRAALLRPLGGHAVAPRSVRDGAGDPVPPRAERERARQASGSAARRSAASGDRISRPSVLHFLEPSGPPESLPATLVPMFACGLSRAVSRRSSSSCSSTRAATTVSGSVLREGNESPMPALQGGVGQGGEGTGERWLRYAQRHRWMLSRDPRARKSRSSAHPAPVPNRSSRRGSSVPGLERGSTPAEETQG